VQQGKNLALAAVGKIRGVQQRKRGGGQETALFPAPGGRLDQRRGVPLREMQAVAADFQPALQQIELGAFAGPVDAFDHNERPWVLPGRLDLRGGLNIQLGGRLLGTGQRTRTH